MPKPDPRVLARTAGNYLKEHPEEIVRALRSALGLRASIPMDALRYLAREFVPDNKKAPKDIVIEAAPPGVRIAATVDAMGTPLRASLILHIEEIAISLTEMRIGVRIEGLTLTVLGDSSSPLAGLLKSGALDLSKPGNLVAFMPKRPPMLVEAKDDRLTLDLMKVPKIAENPKVRRYLSIVLPVASVRAIRTKDDHLDVHLKANLGGLSQAIAAARQTV
ncbi:MULTISPECIES: hypothetical protein [Polyangium]|uniref:Uncharacterized protein n=2 Tax=Polyangium TaxID=55 RepID=A0A4U1J0V6_9BACT|nr:MULTISPECIES: hypothetical protein [Polyangium]MDI1430587.1 hypothetical protein [Polyangium sorediatum]TKD00669.1 hypothetical protein E8A74_33630 [Polyangium fumosum]